MAKKTNRGAADDIALMATSGLGTDLNAWLNQQGIGAEETAKPEPALAPVVASEPKVVAQEEDSTPVPEVITEKSELKPVKPKAESVSAPKQDEAAAPIAGGKTGKQRDRYEGQFFQRIEGFKKPTNMMYMSEKTYRLLTFLLRCSKESNTKITMPEILENIISQHIKDNEVIIGQMRQEHLERQAQGF
jgi:hypothetical protein